MTSKASQPLVYGLRLPAFIRLGWYPCSMSTDKASAALTLYNVPADWPDPALCVVWCDREDAIRHIAAEYADGRRVDIRITAMGGRRTSFDHSAAVAFGNGALVAEDVQRECSSQGRGNPYRAGSRLHVWFDKGFASAMPSVEAAPVALMMGAGQ